MATTNHAEPQKGGNETIEQKYIRLLEQHNRLLMENREHSGADSLRRLSMTVQPNQELQSGVDTAKEADTASENCDKIQYRMKRINKEGFQVEEKHDPEALQGTQTNTTGKAATFIYHFDGSHNHVETEIKIENEAVRCLLQENLKHYPGYHWKSPGLSLFSPFQPLIHNWDKLTSVITNKPEDGGSADLKAILDAVQAAKEVKEYFTSRNSADDSVAFEFLWTIFPPGKFILFQSSFMDQPQVFIVREVARGETEHGDRPYMGIICWAYDWDGARARFNRVAVELKIDHYKGKRLITSLPCYPLDCQSNSEVEQLKEELIKRGKRFRELCMCPRGKQMYEYDATAYFRGTGVRHLQGSQSSGLSDEASFIYRLTGRRPRYPGAPAVTSKKSRRQHLKGKVMIDFDSYVRHGPTEPTPIGELTLADEDGDDECRCDVCMEDGGPKDNQKYLWDMNEGREDSFCSDQYLICPPRVLGYHLMEKKWVELQVNCVMDIGKSQVTDAFAKLQLSEPKKTLIRDLVRGHTNDKIPHKKTPRNRMNDLTKGKGEGLVILLHGPPGVGKTLTAESIAQATEKPLFPIGVGDVTTDPSLVEKRLEQLFELAEVWQAVMLFDEADVFLESRAATTDVTRVGLVSVLLRVLEYYQGILILTTNRIRSFDIAVQSRINLAIKFEDLTEKQKKNIFRHLISQLDDNYVENKSMLLHWMNEDEEASVAFSQLNGRQVRNIVFSAASLAGNREPPNNVLEQDDIVNMLNKTVEFQKHLHELTKAARNKNEI